MRRRRPHRHPTRSATAVLALAAAIAVSVSACGSSSTSAKASTTTTATGSTTKGSGPVSVLYAGSLVAVMEKQIVPGFTAADGYTFNGLSGGSKDLAADISGKVKQADVFVSASPDVDTKLQGASHGNWLSWYATFATSGLVLGYNPHSRFAPALKAKPWYDVVAKSGFLLGRTDPATDPKGLLAVEALDQTAKARSLPALASLATQTREVFPEETLVGRLQSGQLDAGFFYASEAEAAGIPTVPLAGVHLGATFTVSVVNRAPHAAAAIAFVRYLLGPAGLAALGKDGFDLVEPPKVSGSGVPGALSGVLGSQ